MVEDYIADAIRKKCDSITPNPNVNALSLTMVLASQNLVLLIDTIKKQNKKKEAYLLMSTFISGFAMSLTDNIDEAISVLKKSKDMVIETEAEINKIT